MLKLIVLQLGQSLGKQKNRSEYFETLGPIFLTQFSKYVIFSNSELLFHLDQRKKVGQLIIYFEEMMRRKRNI